MSFLIDPYRFGAAYDTDAQAYITAVESADGQALETGVRDAINMFVVGCKADGIWTAIKACCILAGARTLAGALVPLVGTAPTNFNFVSGDYNRETGLIGNGSTKYLDTVTAPSSLYQQNSAHLSVYSTQATSTGAYIGANTTTPARRTSYIQANNSAAINTDDGYATSTNTGGTGFIGAARSSSSSFVVRGAGSEATTTASSFSPSTVSHAVFARKTSVGVDSHLNGRLAFYSIGESLTLSLLDSRVSTLITAIAAAIP
jgi:hypothetical protein